MGAAGHKRRTTISQLRGFAKKDIEIKDLNLTIEKLTVKASEKKHSWRTRQAKQQSSIRCREFRALHRERKLG